MMIRKIIQNLQAILQFNVIHIPSATNRYRVFEIPESFVYLILWSNDLQGIKTAEMLRLLQRELSYCRQWYSLPGRLISTSVIDSSHFLEWYNLCSKRDEQ